MSHCTRLVVASFALAVAAPVPIHAASTLPTDAEHLIVCPSEFAPTFQTLASHRSQAGVPSTVVTLDDALAAAPPGRDDAETLRNYLVQLHAAGNLRFVLLAGDATRMPVRWIHSTFYPPGGFTDLVSDLYFAGLEGDWDADGDGMFGEPYVSGIEPGDDADLDPEVAVGRAPVQNAAQAQRFVEGAVTYDLTQTQPFDSALLVAEGNEFSDGADLAEDIRGILLSHPHAITSYRLYENWMAHPGSNPLTLSAALSRWNAGLDGVAYYVVNGNCLGLSMADGVAELADINALENAPSYGISFLLSGCARQLDGICLLEHLLTAPQGGSAAALGFTQVVFPNSASNYAEDFATELVAAPGVRLGDALKATLHTRAPNTFWNTTDRWTSLTLVLLGDPALAFRSESQPIPIQSGSFGALKSRFRPKH